MFMGTASILSMEMATSKFVDGLMFKLFKCIFMAHPWVLGLHFDFLQKYRNVGGIDVYVVNFHLPLHMSITS